MNIKSLLSIKRSNSGRRNNYLSRANKYHLYYGILLGIIITVTVILTTNYFFNHVIHYSQEKMPALPKRINQENHQAVQFLPTESNKNLIFPSTVNLQPVNSHKFSSKAKNSYVLEIANVNDIITADSIKAKLALYGFEATIKAQEPRKDKTIINKYVVIIGFTDNKHNATAIMNKLRVYGFNDVIIKQT